jgi:hypothetical protein
MLKIFIFLLQSTYFFIILPPTNIKNNRKKYEPTGGRIKVFHTVIAVGRSDKNRINNIALIFHLLLDHNN